MIATYSIRLAILCLASFFLIHLAIGLLSLGLFRRIARAAASMRPQQASTILILLRLGPACLSLLLVLTLCLPSYLRYEGNHTSEEIGLLCLVPACLGFLICLTAFVRAMGAVIQSSSLSHTVCAAKDSSSWHLANGAREFPSFGLVGLLKPKVVVSPRVLDTLTPEQFQAALEHEQAHRSSGDNLKRLLILLAPDLVPFLRSFRTLEDQWDLHAELAADDLATRGNPVRSIALAEALIRLARLDGNEAQPPLVSGLFAARKGLAARVERLLRFDSVAESHPRFPTLFWVAPSLLLAGSALLLPQLQVFRGVYRLLESLLR
jgi:hypothetical protein